MDSWTLQRDSYSLLRGAPSTFSLCHREGTPNHVELFDIINIPTQRSVISETTCLCDIFGDDGESASLSSSPAVVPFAPSQTEVEGRAAASPQVDDLNDSSGSYHTAPGSSEGEESFDNSRERYYSPVWQKESPDGRQAGEAGLNSEHPQVAGDSISSFEQRNTTPALLYERSPPSPVTRSSQGLNSSGTTPSPGYNSPSTFKPDGSLSSLSSSPADTKIEPRTITPSFKDRQSSPSIQSLSPSLPQDLFEPGDSHLNRGSSLSPGIYCSHDFTDIKSTTAFSSSIPHSVDSESPSEGRLVSPELRNSSPSPTARALSPSSELRGRVSVPDLFSRGSTPDIKDSADSTELISDLSIARRDTSTTPQSQDTGLSTGPGSSVSTPGPRYTPPSPVISAATSPELVEDTVSAGIRNSRTSPRLLSPAFPTNAESRSPPLTPSPTVQNNLTLSEIRSQASSLGDSNSLSPLPGVQQSSSPLEERYTSLSPEIRIVSSSPELSRKEQRSQATPSPGLQQCGSSLEERHTAPSPEIEIVAPSPDLLSRGQPSQVIAVSESPLLEPHFGSASPRSFTSSPHITGVSYSVVQPEETASPTLPELSDISSQEPNEFLAYSEFDKESVDTSVAESTGSQRNSPHLSDFRSSASPARPINQTSSPRPNYLPSPEPRHQIPSPVFQSPLSQHQHPSPEAPFLEPRYQQSPAAPSPELNPERTEPVPLGGTSDIQTDTNTAAITETPSAHLAKEAVSPSFQSERREETDAAESKSSSSVVDICSPTSASSDKKTHDSQAQLIAEREGTKQEEYSQETSRVANSTQEKHNTQTPFSGEEELKAPHRDITSHRAPSEEPVQTQESLHPLVPSHALNCDSDIDPQSWTSRPQNLRRQLSPKVIQDNRERLAGDMSRHVNRRRTPSPPLTRFTPVHIIAPQKPHRKWQNRSNSPSQASASSLSGNSKEAITNRESPNVDPVDNNSQAHWGRIGKQLEMDREMPLEQERDVGMGRQMDREVDSERKREEPAPERGEGWQGVESYRGEQVELSFNARNRKGPVSRSAAPTTRETRQGLPTAHSYPESLRATRQLQEQQSLLKLAPLPDASGFSGSRRLKPPTSREKRSAPRRAATSRPCQSSSSSMGSELDEADHEVKWLTDVAFRSLSSPEVDYLEMYNSSHCSSTNISQPSTHDSPAGVNAAWLSYADFRGSAPKLDLAELSSHQPFSHSLDALDPSRRYELGSFECIDVALEREDCRKARRGVPKRQIQLKRRSNTEGRQDESSENSSPGLPVMAESPSQEAHPRGPFVRQHSTPAAMQETPLSESSYELSRQKERQAKFQKSASMDETCSKTKIASCLIKSVLSKKMQDVDRQPDEQAREEVSPATESAPSEESPKVDSSNLSSSLPSDHGLSFEGLSLSGEPGAKDQAPQPKDHRVKSSYRPSSSSSSRSVTFSQSDNEEAASQTRSAKLSASEMKSEFNKPSESTRGGLQRWKTHDRVVGESEKAPAWDTGPPTARAASNVPARVTNPDQECENKQQSRQLLQADEDAYTSKTQEIKLKAVEKKKASLNVCLTPEAETKSFPPDASAGEKEQETEAEAKDKMQDEGHEDNRAKAPIHKVRDVRRLIKNTYNLSFKAVSPVDPSDVKKDNCNNETREEVYELEARNVLQEASKEERREERLEEFSVARTRESQEEANDSKTPPLLHSPQNKANPPSGPQPMQIECKAVCWKDDRRKTSSIKKDLGDKPQASSVSSTGAKAIASPPERPMGEKRIQKLDEPDMSSLAEKKQIVTEIPKVSETEDRPTLARTEPTKAMLGSLPRLPSKEREVSTAVVLIRERSNKSTRPASLTCEETSAQIKAPVSLSPGPSASGGGGGHSVSMLLKEKGYQADIGAVVGDSQNVGGGKEAPCKHVNSLEIPLQTIPPSERGFPESQRGRTFSSSSTTSGHSAGTESVDVHQKPVEEEGVSIKPPKKDSEMKRMDTQDQTPLSAKQKDTLGDFEAVKRLDPTFPPRSPAIRRFKPPPGETRSPSKDTEKKDTLTSSLGNHRPQMIEVKSIAKNAQKPAVPPKPNCKFKPGDLGNVENEAQRTSAASSTGRQRSEERPQTIVVSSPTVYRKISSEAVSASNYSRKLSVSAVSSLKPPPHRTTAATASSVSNASKASSDTEAAANRGQRQQPSASPQSSENAQKPGSLTRTFDLGEASQPLSEPNPNQNIEPTQSSTDPDGRLQCSEATCAHEQTRPVPPNAVKQPPADSTTQRYTYQPYSRAGSSEYAQRMDEQHCYASDDPPSYDERESFSPLLLPNLTSVRSNQYQAASRPPPCSCTAGYPSPCGPTPPHNLTPPGQPHSPGHALPYQVAPPPLHPHHCRAEPQLGYQPRSPKSSPLGPNPPPSMYQSLHHSAACASHPSLMPACPAERSLPPQQHIGPRRPPVHRSPHQQPPSLIGAPYSDPGHSHSPGIPPMDPQYLCGPQSMGPSYGSEYGGDSSSVYSESSYGQPPRRVLLDPETGKYFYIEVPVQPLRKMLFDPETGQYVEVLIPQQAMSHSGLYPPAAAPYPPLHNPNMYAPAPQYMPCAAPPPLAHPQAQPQPPQYPEATAAPPMHPGGPGVNYRNPSGQGSKPEPKNPPPLDQRYLENMYYVSSMINASPNTTPPDYYHRHLSNLPPTGGKRS
ncbi:mucin-12 isoform X3 [Fundulus heteroclitus]|uniref:mucin-12 isoform X2 n=1 Tax=Fundulus heteroclitus TaxID=8078 RepID=UPI00165A7F24|nr:mucin-12 isoform X2 [Fundulus heteroclitus]XP_035983679.1 mucin-12 isoform X3 [Fundulus heteroclitus]